MYLKTLFGYKSQYSLAETLNKTDKILPKMKEMGYENVAISDNNLSHSYEFGQLTAKNEIGAVYSLDVGLKDLVLDKTHAVRCVAVNQEGYQNLLYLTTKSYERNEKVPYLLMEDLESHQDGIVFFNGGINSELYAILAFEEYNKEFDVESLTEELFKKWSTLKNWVIELDAHLPKAMNDKVLNSKALNKQVDELGIKVVAVPKIYYRKQEDAVHRSMMAELDATQEAKPTSIKAEFSNNFHLFTPEDTEELFADVIAKFPNIIKDTNELGEEALGIKLPKAEALPDFDVEEFIQISANEEPQATNGDSELGLRLMVLRGFDKLFPLINPDDPFDGPRKKIAKGKTTQDYLNQIDFELETVNKMGFNNYFLIVQDLINWGKDKGIYFGPGRGSAAGSLMALCLGITERIDPIKYNLFFERFLNPNRSSMPDVDIDIEKADRDKVYNYLQDKYGHERTAQIATFLTMGLKQVIKLLGKSEGLTFSERNDITNNIPDKDEKGKDIESFEQLETMPYFANLLKNSEEVRNIFEVGKYFLDMPRTLGKHAAGAIVSKKPLQETVGLYSVNGGYVTQFDKAVVEDGAGLLKIDLLGLQNLDIIKGTIKLIKEQISSEGLPYGVGPFEIPTDIEECEGDPVWEEMVRKTYEMLGNGDTSNVFQLESFGMRNLLKQINPDKLDVIDAIVALYRPGPMAMIPDYIEGRRQNKILSPRNKWFNEVTKDTYGILIYQEQVMSLASTMSGMNPAQADDFRRAISKKDEAKLQKLKPEFINGAVNTNGIAAHEAEEIFDLIKQFASYGFNRAHSICYALVAYITAFLKANYRPQFLASALNIYIDDSKKLGFVLSEIQKTSSINGIKILKPEVGESRSEFYPVPNGNGGFDIRYGLSGISSVNSALGKALEVAIEKEDEEIDSLDKALSLIPRHLRSSSGIKNLIYSGALDKYSPNSRQALIVAYEEQLNEWLKFNENCQEFDHYLDEPTIEISESLEMEYFAKLAQEKRVAHVYISEHPLTTLQGKTVSELLEFSIGQKTLLSDSSVNELPTSLEELEDRVREIMLGNETNNTAYEEKVTAWVLVFGSLKSITTKNGDQMGLLKLEDISNSELTLTLFPQVHTVMTTPQGTQGAMLDKLVARPLLIRVEATPRNGNREEISLSLAVPKFSDNITDIAKVFHRLNIETISKRYYVPARLMTQEVINKLNRVEGIDELMVVNPLTMEVTPYLRKVNLTEELKKDLNIIK